MPSSEKKSGYYKLFVLCVILSVIAIGMLFAAIWISTGDDTGRYFGTACLIGIPAIIGAVASGVEEWD